MKKVIMIVTNRYDPDVRIHKEAIHLVNRAIVLKSFVGIEKMSIMIKALIILMALKL